MGEELQQLHSRGFIESPNIPDLGPIPASSPISPQPASGDASSDENSDSESNSESDGDEEEDEEDTAAAEDDEEEEYEEKGAKNASSPSTRPRTRRIASKTTNSAPEDEKEDSTKLAETGTTAKPESKAPARKRKRGRPPKIDTPEEARIRSVLRAIRKVKDTDGRQLFLEFEKLPDPEQYPDYYKEIKKPIALDHITVTTLVRMGRLMVEKNQDSGV